MLLPRTYRVTKYDPADRDERGHYVGAETVHSDHGPVEAAYLAAVAAFAEESGVTHLTIREPLLTVINFGLEPTIDGQGLAGLFPSDLTGYHDGAHVSVAIGLELVRAMLRDNGAWCRLEVEDRFSVHVGYDQYVYVGSAVPCAVAVAFTHDSGLFAEPIDASPYATEFSDDTDGERAVADAAFWQQVGSLVADRGTVMLEEGHVLNAARWHRLTPTNIETVRASLAPRARLWVWPDLPARSADAHPASPERDVVDGEPPLLAGVLSDPDGVLRARWSL